jgi:hypothetical protein
MKKNIYFLCFAVVLMVVNISQNFQINRDSFTLTQLLNVAVADSEGGGSECTTGSELGGQLNPCPDNPSYEYGDVWGNFWCEGTGQGDCITGGYNWSYSCNGTAIGVSTERNAKCI